MYRLSNSERETIINYNETEDTASVYTCNKALRRRLEQLAQEWPSDCRLCLFRSSLEGQAVENSIPKSWIRIRPPRQVSAAQRQAIEKARFAKKNACARRRLRTSDILGG